MNPKRLSFLGAILLILSSEGFGSSALSTWRSLFMERVRSESISPNLTIRNLTLLSLSAHDALNLVEKRYQPYATHEPAGLTEWNGDWIVYGCGWQLGTHLHPANLGKFDQVASEGLKEDADPVVRKSFLFGTRVARAYLEGRKADGSTGTTITKSPLSPPTAWKKKACNPPLPLKCSLTTRYRKP